MSISPSRVLRLVGAIALVALAALAPGLSLAAEAAPVGCPPPPAPIDADQFRAGLRDAVVDRGFLWRIERDGRASYLYGTIHVAKREWIFPGVLTKQALAASDTVALELDVLDADIATRMADGVKARANDGLPAELVERIDRRMTAECMAVAQGHALAPEFQIAMISLMAARREGVDPAYAIDAMLAVVGRVLGKKVVSLETPESQVAALRPPTHEATVALVKEGLDDLDSGREVPIVHRLTEAWRASDFATLDDYERWCDCLRNDAERQAMKGLLDDRNVAIAARIDAMHSAGQAVFAAVGSLHMIGPQGLPALMRERGFRVERVAARQ